MCQIVYVTKKKLNSLTRTYDDVEFEGRIVGRYCNDIDKPTTYRVSIIDIANPLEKKKYVDISAEKEYYKARMKYVDKNPNDKTSLDVLHENKNIKAVQKEKRLELKRRKQVEDARINELNQVNNANNHNEVNDNEGFNINSIAIIKKKIPKVKKALLQIPNIIINSIIKGYPFYPIQLYRDLCRKSHTL